VREVVVAHLFVVGHVFKIRSNGIMHMGVCTVNLSFFYTEGLMWMCSHAFKTGPYFLM
jgi:hypothetical protein